MTAVVRTLDSVTLDKILDDAVRLPRGNVSDDSRTADKFVVRAYTEMFAELDRLAVLQLRSKNSECVMAIMDSLDGRERSASALKALIGYADMLRPNLSIHILEHLPEFEMSECTRDDKFVVRFPSEVRSSISHQAAVCREPMVNWVRRAFVYWINNQRQQQALIQAIAAIHAHQAKE